MQYLAGAFQFSSLGTKYWDLGFSLMGLSMGLWVRLNQRTFCPWILTAALAMSLTLIYQQNVAAVDVLFKIYTVHNSLQCI